MALAFRENENGLALLEPDPAFGNGIGVPGRVRAFRRVLFPVEQDNVSGFYHLPQEKNIGQGTLGCQGNRPLEVHKDHEGVHKGVGVVGNQEDRARFGHIIDPFHFDPSEEDAHRGT
jgi:hypothetical protein